MLDLIITAISAFALVLTVFLLFRRFWLWYFGVAEITRLLRSIDTSLRQLPAVRRYDHTIGR